MNTILPSKDRFACLKFIKSIKSILAMEGYAGLVENCDDLISRMESLSEGAIPEGYTLAPIEPTEAMVDAALLENDCFASGNQSASDLNQSIYKAMVSASKDI